MKNNLFPIAKEGWKYIGCSSMLFFLFFIFDILLLELFSLFLIAFFVYIYRNPERENVLYQENSVVSPVDGKIISIENTKDENQYLYILKIDSSYVNVSLLRSPVNAKIDQVEVNKGARLSNLSKLANKINEQAEIIFKDQNNNLLKIKHLLKKTIAPISIDLYEQQQIMQGSRYGVMVSGITTLYLTHNFRLNVNVGAEVKASQTLIGYFS